MGNLLIRRRELILPSAPAGKIYLYDNGTVSDTLGSFSSVAYASHTTYNVASVESDKLHLYKTNSSSASSIRGANSLSSANELPSSFIGKTLYAECKYVSTGSTPKDTTYLVISSGLTSSSAIDTAFVQPNIKASRTFTVKDETYFTLELPITIGGYISVAYINQSGSNGKMDFYVYSIYAM